MIAAPLSLVVEHVRLAPDPNLRETALQITLSRDSARVFRTFTTAHVGATLAMMVNGKIVATPILRAPISDGVLVLNAVFDEQKWQELAAQLRRPRARLEVDVKN